VADPAFQASDVSLEELVLAYMGQQSMGQDALPALTHLSTVGEEK
jgi:hypothetical protein